MGSIEIKDLTIEYLGETPVGKELEKAFEIYGKAQQAALTISSIGNTEELTLTKIGTVLSLNLFGTLLGGKSPKDLTRDDWEKITGEVINKAVLTEDRDYSIYVFELYTDYIDVSVKALSARATNEQLKKRIEALGGLADQLREYKEKLQNNSITETDYIENCLWTSLDAMIKCMSLYIGCFTSAEIGDLIQSASTFAFEYGRLKLYRKEQELLNEFINDQNLLDDQLQVKLSAYKRELQEEADKFNELLSKAFDSNFRESLMGSINLARNAGVNENEILKSVDEIDDFFME